MSRHRLISCSAALLMLCTQALAYDPAKETGDLSSRYAAMADISLLPQEGLQRLALPLPVLQASRSASWSDVRVLNAQGRPVPMAWLPLTPPASTHTQESLRSAALPQFSWPAATTAVKSQATDLRVQVNSTGAVVKIEASSPATAASTSPATPPRIWLLDLSALPRPGRAIEQLQLDWPAQTQGLSSRVDLEGSDDAQRWSRITSGPLLELPAMNGLPAASDAVALASTQPLPPSVKHVAWPAGVAMPRYLRLTFEQPLALSRAQLRWLATAPPAALSTSPVQFQAVAADDTQGAHWALDLQGPVPVQQLRLNLPQINTVLGLRLERRNHTQEAWRSVSSFVAWRLLREGSEQHSGPIEWDARSSPAARYWRLVPEARTVQLPAQALDAHIGWQTPQLLLVAQGGGALRLAVGREPDPGVAAPWQTLVPGADQTTLEQLPLASLGVLTPQLVVEPKLKERLQTSTPEDQRRWLLWGVLALAVIGLGGLARRLGKDMKPGR